MLGSWVNRTKVCAPTFRKDGRMFVRELHVFYCSESELNYGANDARASFQS